MIQDTLATLSHIITSSFLMSSSFHRYIGWAGTCGSLVHAFSYLNDSFYLRTCVLMSLSVIFDMDEPAERSHTTLPRAVQCYVALFFYHLSLLPSQVALWYGHFKTRLSL